MKAISMLKVMTFVAKDRTSKRVRPGEELEVDDNYLSEGTAERLVANGSAEWVEDAEVEQAVAEEETETATKKKRTKRKTKRSKS